MVPGFNKTSLQQEKEGNKIGSRAGQGAIAVLQAAGDSGLDYGGGSGVVRSI